MVMTPHDFVVEAKAQIKEVSTAEAQKLIASGINVLDVREPEEYGAGHLPGALNVPRGVLEFKIGMVPQFADKASPVLVYCKTSGRAALSAVALQKLGYGAVVSLAGGFDLWNAESLPVEKPQQPSYE